MENANRNKYFVGALTASSAVLLMAMSQAYASQLIGAPASWTKKGDVTVSVEYAKADTEYDRLMPWEEVPDTANYAVSSSAISFKAAYGVMDGVAISVHYGDAEGDIDMYSNNGSLQWVSNGGDGSRAGFGADIVVFKNDNWTLGINGNYSKVKYDSPTVRLGGGGSGNEIVSIDEVRLGIGAGYNINADLMVYGGYVAINASGDRFIEGYGGNRNALEESNMSGGYVGVAYKLGPVLFGLEAQYSGSDNDVLGGSIGYKF